MPQNLSRTNALRAPLTLILLPLSLIQISAPT